MTLFSHFVTSKKAIEALRAKKKAERAEKVKEEERLAEKKANEKLVENYRQKKAEQIAQEKKKKKDIELEEQRIKPGITWLDYIDVGDLSSTFLVSNIHHQDR